MQQRLSTCASTLFLHGLQSCSCNGSWQRADWLPAAAAAAAAAVQELHLGTTLLQACHSHEPDQQQQQMLQRCWPELTQSS